MAHRFTGTIGIGALLLACGTAHVAIAQGTAIPTDAELRSAYCIPVLRWQLKMFNDTQAALERSHEQGDASFKQNPPSSDVQRQLADLEKKYLEAIGSVRGEISRMQSTLDRLRAYLLPRMMQLDGMAIALATTRGEADLRDFQAMTGRCGNQCGISDQPGLGPNDKEKACFESCADKELAARLRACSSPTWLPF
jgi:hypothetical protein